MVDPNPLEEPERKEREIEISENIGRELTSCYLSGYDRILVRSESRITPKEKEKIKDSSSSLAGLELIDETSNSLLLVNLKMPGDLSVRDIMKRMNEIGASMFRDTLIALSEGDTDLANDVVERDDALDRLYFLVIRLLKSAVNDLRLADKMEVTPSRCLDLRLAASVMEKIGDVSVEMNSHILGGHEELASLDNEVVPLGQEMTESYRKATRALLTGSFELASQVGHARAELAEKISKLRKSTTTGCGSSILDRIEDVADHIFDIADVVTEG